MTLPNNTRYHRLLRREKLRKQRKDVEELQKKDPEAALEILKELELARIEERMSLRHKKSKWAQFQGTRATRDSQVSVCVCGCACTCTHLSITGASNTKVYFKNFNYILYIFLIFLTGNGCTEGEPKDASGADRKNSKAGRER